MAKQLPFLEHTHLVCNVIQRAPPQGESAAPGYAGYNLKILVQVVKSVVCLQLCLDPLWKSRIH